MFGIVFIMAFTVAVYAFNQTNDADKTTASCCAKKENCPLKNKNAATATAENASTDSCCANADCCCKTGACPMKARGEKSADCCANCCGGSCPMKNKSAETVAAQTDEASCHHNRTAGS